ncbi:MAG: hypothetical protein IJW59_05650 [Clostridia bacterium]|nr:hypothetical protein [Clostridia bacterium]
MFGNKKLILGLILGLVGAVAIFCITVGVGCAVNGLTFGEQIVEWFGNSAPVIEDAVEQVTEKVAETPIA